MKKIYILLICTILMSCADDFLDVPPSINSSSEIETVEQLDKMFNGIFMPRTSEVVHLFCTDNTYIPQSIVDESSSFRNEQIQQYLFKTEIDRDSDYHWANRYRNILIPNLAIEYLESGNLEGDDEELKTLLKAEAHFIRAVHMIDLLVAYCLYPSAENEGELGLVLRETTSYEESLERATLGETIEFIKADLEEALMYPHTEKKSIYRIGKPSVHALAARFYLYLGDFDNAMTHADAALSGNNTMINFEDSVYPYSGTFWYGDFEYPNTASQSTFGGTSVPDFWVDQYYFVASSNDSWNTSPSQELLDLYDPKDIRNLFYIKDWFFRNAVTTTGWYTYMNTYIGTTLTGPGVPEMYLTRAECKARNNDIAGAMQDVEMLRSHRFAAADYAALSLPSSAKDAIEVIVEERRREDPFEYRLMDIKRLNNDPVTDPIILTRTVNGETVSIEPNSRLWARPIGNEIIDLSGGKTKQNEY